MKRFLATAALSALLLATLHCTALASGCGTGTLWAEYKAATVADKPLDRLAALDRILDVAARRHLAWDFYEAWNRKVEVSSARDWRTRDSLASARDRAFNAFDEPVINMLESGYGLEELEEARTILQGRRNDGFYGKMRFLSNDYEYLLWRLLPYSRIGDGDAPVVARMRDVFGPVMELYALQYDFLDEYDSLCARSVSESEFKAFRNRLSAFEKRRTAIKGKPGQLASTFTEVRELSALMDASDLSVRADSSRLTILFKNLRSAALTLGPVGEDTREILHLTVRDSVGRYFVRDTVTLDLPPLDDGEYEAKVQNGDVVAECTLSRHFVSAALRREYDGWKIYAAEYHSGRPLPVFDIFLYGSGDKEVASIRGFQAGEGMSPLPPSVARAVDSNNSGRPRYLVCAYTDERGIRRSSGKLYLYNRPPVPYVVQTPVPASLSSAASPAAKVATTATMHTCLSQAAPSELCGTLLKNCAAFHRGDSVKFKAIIYAPHRPGGELSVCGGVPFTVRMLDPEGKSVCSVDLTTSEYGSAAAAFGIPDDVRGGRFRLELLCAGRMLAVSSFVADDFILPDFDCTFGKIKGLYCAGDSVTVEGRITAFSGHNVAVTGAYYEISGQRGRHRFEPAPDGSFALRVALPRQSYGYVGVMVTVNASTGESLQFTKDIPLYAPFTLNVEYPDALPAEINAPSDAVFPSGCLVKYALADSDTARFVFDARNADGSPLVCGTDYEMKYRLCAPGVNLTGVCDASGALCLPLPASPGEYRVTFTAAVPGREKEREDFIRKVEYRLVRLSSALNSLDAELEHIFVPIDHGNEIAFAFGASRGPVWAVASLFGDGRRLWTKTLHLAGALGTEGSMTRIALPYESSYPDVVKMTLFYFREGKIYVMEQDYGRNDRAGEIPLTVERWSDSALPGAEYTFAFRSSPEAEAAVTVFDKSTETIFSNLWTAVPRRTGPPSVPMLRHVCGEMSSYGGRPGIPVNAILKTAALPSADYANSADGLNGMGEALPEQSSDGMLRNDFATAVLWKPLLHPDKDGSFKVVFNTSDKTGTFIANVFTHDRNMRNACLRRCFRVALPVQLSVTPPAILREGDRYTLRALVSSSPDAVSDITGTLTADAGAIGRFSTGVTVPRGGSAGEVFTIGIPDDFCRDSNGDALKITLSFKDEGNRFGDAVSFSIKVLENEQVLQESHSAVIFPGADSTAILDELRAKFTNTPADGAAAYEISVLDKVTEALESCCEGVRGQGSGNALDLSDAAASAIMLLNLARDGVEVQDTLSLKKSLGELLSPLAALQNEDGGFAWFDSFDSSPSVTATVLERNALCGGAFLNAEQTGRAVAYLDKSVQAELASCGTTPLLNALPDLGRYLFIRSFYPETPVIRPNAEIHKKMAGLVAEHLFPADSRSLSGGIHAKIQRLATLKNLLHDGTEAGLLTQWGVKVGERRIRKSLEADVGSLVQYVSDGPDGSACCPSLSLPHKTPAQSGLYFHSLLCNLLQDCQPRLSEGIRLWLALQKETQRWGSDFAFTNAAATVLSASSRTLGMKVLVLSKTYEKPCNGVVSTGNGFSISADFSVTGDDGTRRMLAAGDSLRVGDRVTATYRLRSESKRSFVRLTVPRAACLRPSDQLSGRIWRWLHSSVSSSMVIPPQGYREVRSDKTFYWLDECPERETVITEDFFVSQEGRFTAPAPEVESLYAPHYRANGEQSEFFSLYLHP